MKTAFRLFITASCLMILAGCGVRGPLEPPPSSKNDKAVQSEKSKDAEQAHRPFILDGLLR